MHWNGLKNAKIVKNCLVIVKNVKKKYEDCDCYLEYKKVIKNTYFIFECLKCEKIRYL